MITRLSVERGRSADGIAVSGKVRQTKESAAETRCVPEGVGGVEAGAVGPPQGEIEIGLGDGVIAGRRPVAPSLVGVTDLDGGIEVSRPQLGFARIDRAGIDANEIERLRSDGAI